MKNIVKIIIFISIFCLIWKIVFSILWLPAKNNAFYFYEQPHNSIDVVYIGGSNVHHHFNPMLAYELYGFKTFMFATGVQPFVLAKYIIEEIEKTQSPTLYIVDLARLIDDFAIDFSEEWTRAVTDLMPNSKTKLNAINAVLKYANIDKSEYINYYFGFFKYHNSWKNVAKSNFSNKFKYKGYFFGDESIEIVPQEEFIWNDKEYELPKKNKEVLTDLLDYIKTNNINALFVIPKTTFWHEQDEELNYATNIINKYGYDVMNFNTIKDTGLSFSKDYYDVNHLNVYGSTKYTLYFAKYLKENYNLVNHKLYEQNNSWDEEYNNFIKEFQKKTGQNFNSLILKYS